MQRRFWLCSAQRQRSRANSFTGGFGQRVRAAVTRGRNPPSFQRCSVWRLPPAQSPRPIYPTPNWARSNTFRLPRSLTRSCPHIVTGGRASSYPSGAYIERDNMIRIKLLRTSLFCQMGYGHRFRSGKSLRGKEPVSTALTESPLGGPVAQHWHRYHFPERFCERRERLATADARKRPPGRAYHQRESRARRARRRVLPEAPGSR